MATVLVTGGAGYIGSHTCKALAQAGHLPVVFDNLSRGHKTAVKWGPLEIGDILDKERIHQALADHKPDAVMHFAALAYVGESVEKPELYFKNNVQGTHILLDAMHDADIDKLVFSSSCAVYGAPETIPVNENEPTIPLSPYGDTKLKVEQMLSERANTVGLNSISLRYFNAAGADPDGEIGEDHTPEPHLIPNVLLAASTGCELTIYGDDYDTHDGTCVRDYIHVVDIANAHLAALNRLTESQGVEFLNLGTGKGYSIREIIRTVEVVTGKPIHYTAGSRRPGDPPKLIADASKAHTLLNWEASRSDLKPILTDAWQWMNNKAEP
ncbi:MAG: UDP-glucose 4-epimerase GalE [Rhodospirillaceae bacterium]